MHKGWPVQIKTALPFEKCEGASTQRSYDVDSDTNNSKNYVDIIDILAKFESLESADEQHHGKTYYYIVPFHYIGIILNVCRNSSSAEWYISLSFKYCCY